MQLNKLELDELNMAAYEMRRDILDLCLKCGNQKGHLGGCMSAVEVLAVLYLKVMNLSEAGNGDIAWDERDRFIMSKGHAGIAMYAALRQAGILSEEQMNAGIRGDETILYRHPKQNTQYGIECSVGSLGMGIGYAVGLAEAARRRGSQYTTYVMVGDGECDEGSVWEAVSYAAHRRLDNVVFIIDKNGLQLDGATDEVLAMSNLADRFQAFGCETVSINGHDFTEIYTAFSTHHKDKPLAIIANTIKGKGMSFAENKVEWHDNLLTEELYQQGMEELNQKYQVMSSERKDSQKKSYAPQLFKKAIKQEIVLPAFTEEMIQKYAKIGYKDIIGYVSSIIADQDNTFSLIYSDCANRIGITELQKKHPEMCYEVGIAEQNQVMIASAMALEGYNAYAVAYAPFITARVMDQIRANLGYMKSPVKLIGLSAGYAASDLGATHTALEDIANLRCIPNMTVIAPADCTEIAKAMVAAAKIDGPVYLRITAGMKAEQRVYTEDYDFEIGKAVTLREGEAVAIVACGTLVYHALEAAEHLKQKGILCKVINMHTIKPIDKNTLEALMCCKYIYTLEEHSIIGGLGSAVMEFYAEKEQHPKIVRLGVEDMYQVADIPVQSLQKVGLMPGQIADRIFKKIEY